MKWTAPINAHCFAIYAQADASDCGEDRNVGTATATVPKYNWRNISRETPPKRSAPERIRDFDEIYGLFDEETLRAQASRCINCPEAPCARTCPLGNHIPEWLGLAAEGRFLDAAVVSRSTSNMP